MQLAKNLYTVCGYAYSSQDNVYAIQAPHGVILVDTGTDDREYDIVQENLAYGWPISPFYPADARPPSPPPDWNARSGWTIV